MRRLVPRVAAAIVLIALWPAVCQSAVFLPLPWGESVDTWGVVVAVGAALLTYFALRRLLRLRPPA